METSKEVTALLLDLESNLRKQLQDLETEFCGKIKAVCEEYTARCHAICEQAFSTNLSKSQSTGGSPRHEPAFENDENMKNANNSILQHSGITPNYIQKIRSSLQRGKEMYLHEKQNKNDKNVQDDSTLSGVIGTMQTAAPEAASMNAMHIHSIKPIDAASISNISNHTGTLLSLDMDFQSQASHAKFASNQVRDLDTMTTVSSMTGLRGEGLSLSDLESNPNRDSMNFQSIPSTISRQYQASSLNSSNALARKPKKTHTGHKRKYNELVDEKTQQREIQLRNSSISKSLRASIIKQNIEREMRLKEANAAASGKESSTPSQVEMGSYYQKFRRSVKAVNDYKPDKSKDYNDALSALRVLTSMEAASGSSSKGESREARKPKNEAKRRSSSAHSDQSSARHANINLRQELKRIRSFRSREKTSPRNAAYRSKSLGSSHASYMSLKQLRDKLQTKHVLDSRSNDKQAREKIRQSILRSRKTSVNQDK